jgi:hypothetical protein
MSPLPRQRLSRRGAETRRTAFWVQRQRQGLTEIHEKGYIDNLLKDVLAQISLIEAPLEILGKLLPKEPAAPVADAEPLP